MYLFATAVMSSITSIVFVELFYLSSVLEILLRVTNTLASSSAKMARDYYHILTITFFFTKA